MDNAYIRDRVVAKARVWEEVPYTNNSAYGDVYIPLEVYTNNKEKFDSMILKQKDLSRYTSVGFLQTDVFVDKLGNFIDKDTIKSNYETTIRQDLSKDLYFKITQNLSKEDSHRIATLTDNVKFIGDLIDELPYNGVKAVKDL